MMTFQVDYPASHSKIQLLLRLVLGVFYIYLPHLFLLFFVAVIGFLVWIYSTFYILLFGVYPVFAKNFLLGLLKWLCRLHLSAYNLRDEYPKFGIYVDADYLKIIPENREPNRLLVLIRFLFAGIFILPHLFIWFFRNIWSCILSIMAFWMVLFTGKYPQNWFEFNIGTLRWLIKVLGYQLYFTDTYPLFTGKE